MSATEYVNIVLSEVHMDKELPIWEGHNCPVCDKPVRIYHTQRGAYILGCYNTECPVNPLGVGPTLKLAEIEYECESIDLSLLIRAIREGRYSV